ncbi:MAG UNVERIFIED_CONTAM: hypothetical protein LVQ98_01670 [Rickettsiaceae bacterium]
MGNQRILIICLRFTIASDVTSPLAITGSAEVVKQNVAQLYNYSLIDKNTGKELNQGKDTNRWVL